jgi:high-affinity iron transporter
MLAALAARVSGQTSSVADGGLQTWLKVASSELQRLDDLPDAELSASGVQRLLRVYLDAYEPIENWYGPGAAHAVEPLATLVARGERTFHGALQARDAAAMRARIRALSAELEAIHAEALRAQVPLVPSAASLANTTRVSGVVTIESLRSEEIRSIYASLSAAETEYAAGRGRDALARIEDAYLQQVEPLEPRLPGPVTRRIESLIHLRLRPMVSNNAASSEVQPVFAALYGSLADADAALAGGASFWFTAVNAFVIIMREGLEAVLLIAAILAYLSGMGAASRERRRIYAGCAAGVAASFATWGVARTILPVSGAARELLEGVTALVAVLVLIYVSNWLFQKAYIQGWKNYLRERVGVAVTTGSALAMAGLAFAAVYREGFETVLFYQALLYDSSPGAVLAGFAPGLLLILATGALIIKAGVKLPLRKLFLVTNSILLYLAFVFVGKGIYNLQEAGLFAPHPLAWAPENDLLQQVFGFYPMAETTVAQLAFVAMMTATYVYYRSRQNKAVAAPVSTAEQSPAEVSARA